MNDDFEFAWDFGETQELKKDLAEIAKPCPILNPAPNTKTHLFEESTNRRKQLAEDALRKHK